MMRILLTNVLILMTCSLVARAQTADPPPPPPNGQGGPGGPGGPGGGDHFFGGPPGMGQHTEILKKFDKDGDKKLNKEERKEAREYLAKEGGNRRRGGFGGPGGPFGGRGNQEPPQSGEKLSPADVKSYAGETLYDPKVLRTFFLEFEDSDWEKELADFKNTDVELPAKLTVDGKTYKEVGVHFRGTSSFMGVGEGRKRSLAITMDEWIKKQDLLGYRTLHLLNGHEDPSLLRVVLYDTIARAFLPAAKANFVRVVINGENWGIYTNEEQFNKDFTKEWFGTTKGARWKVQGSPGGRGSLAYLGDDPAAYKRIYQIKTKDDKKSWEALIKLCRLLNETPAEKLEETLSPILDIDGALKFLAVENVLINGDGYWIRTSDYNIYLDEKGKFHIIPHDTNEGFTKP
ncbi:MAG TPA: CotH kinase family protein, partial [Tepidisphaeraceae bacterium]|nr:CotH kinase family protein [Tepidisphaeraceae bacterium]